MSISILFFDFQKKYFIQYGILRIFFVVMSVMIHHNSYCQFGDRLFSKNDTAIVPKEIEDPQCTGIHKEPAHAVLMPYANLKEALAAKRHWSSYCFSLNGTWKFLWSAWPQKRPVDFYRPDYDVSQWKDIHVPSNWEIQGYGTPDYSNFTYTFQKDFPHVTSTPPVNYTTYTERDPVGSYRRNFTLPESWNGRRIFVTFDGVDAGFFLWINGKKVGYSVNSRNAAEFDITDYVKSGNNIIAAEVYKFTVGSYLEDQDMWRLSGIFRNVTLWSSPQEHIRDFFIKTDLDKEYKNAQENCTLKIKNYGSVATPQRTLNIQLYSGSSKIQGTEIQKNIPALRPGEEVSIEADFPVKNPQKWTAETPYLYTTVMSIKESGKTVEIISSKTGFRKIEINGRLFLVNGVPIKLKGVNRHENWPDDGHAVTEEQMVRDIQLIKEANCNHVRTCHYSDDPRWYELCDEYGIYLVAEANLECHGSWDEFNEDCRIKEAIIDRNRANVEEFKNHPSVIIWSLGNECGSGGSNFRAALQTVHAIDPTRPTHYQGFGIGDNNPADIDSEMYTDIESLEKHAKDKTLVKPFYLCEYAHSMFNSMGSVDDYNDLFDKYPTLLGGAIWEWQDQGIYNNRDPKHPIIAYGGGFGEVPNDHYFIHKGVVFSDRSPKPQYQELKHVYQWITIRAKGSDKKTFTIKNRYQFLNLNNFSGHWEVSENGHSIATGELPKLDISPGEQKDIAIPYNIHIKADSEYFIRISFHTVKDELWAKKGYEIAWQQIELPNIASSITENNIDTGKLYMKDSIGKINIRGNQFNLVFDKEKGTFTAMIKNNKNLLENGGGPMLHLWRAPHQIDDIWAYNDWVRYGLKSLQWKAENVQSHQINNTATISVDLTGTGNEGFVVHHHVTYIIDGSGTITANNNISFDGPNIVLARIGVRMFLNKDLDSLNYFGRGPMENYADRKLGYDIGNYTSSINAQLTPYEKPMECGNHEDVSRASIFSDKIYGIIIQHKDSLMQISALPYSDEELEKPAYRIDLPKSNHTVLCISHKTLGVGSNGCGPRPLEQYRVYSKNINFSYKIHLL